MHVDLNPDGPALLNELQWVQYNLDTSASVKAAIYQSSKIDILPLYTKVHYFVCDQAECASFEYLNKNLVINRTQIKLSPQAVSNSLKSTSSIIYF